jgi:hypothetical protein
MKWLNFSLWGLLILLFASPIAGAMQTSVCSRIVEDALQTTQRVCDNTRINQACYGHAQLEAEFSPEFSDSSFDSAGEKIDVAALRSLRLSALDVLNGFWGVATMQVQARLPRSAPAERVTFLMFGDVEVRNAVEPTAPLPVATVATAILRQRPDTDSDFLGLLRRGERMNALGRTADDDWLYIERPNTQLSGWVEASSVASESDVSALSVLNPDLVQFGPMQAFYLQTGQSEAPLCAEIPESGMLIQTPDGVAEVSVWINEVKIRLGSTAFVQAQPGNALMNITMLEGEAHVEALGEEQIAEAGEQVTIPITENLQPAAPPNPPVEVPVENWSESLPVENLERNILPTATPTNTIRPTRTATSTPTATTTATATHTVTRTPTLTETSTLIPIEPTTALPTETETTTPTATETLLPTATETVTPTATNTEMLTYTPTNTDMPAPTETETPTPTATHTDSQMPIFTPTPTDTPTLTPTDDQSPIQPPTPTLTPTDTVTIAQTTPTVMLTAESTAEVADTVK